MNGHLQGVPQPYLRDKNQPWLLTTYKSWDDPPSRGQQKWASICLAGDRDLIFKMYDDFEGFSPISLYQ